MHRRRSRVLFVALVAAAVLVAGGVVVLRLDEGRGSSSAPPTTASATSTTTAPTPFHTIADDSGLLSMQVPATWTDVDGRYADDGPSLLASPDLEAWRTGWSTPGVRFFATELFGPADHGDILDAWVPEGCTPGERRRPYTVRSYRGTYDTYVHCGATGASVMNVVLSPLAPTELVFLQVTTIGAADRQVLDRVLATFRVGDLAGGISAG